MWIKCSTLILETQTLMAQNELNPSVLRKGQIKEKIKQLKEELHRSIQVYGIAHEKTIEISQRLDIEIVKEQKVRMKKYE